jgi:hypothetical protein
MGSCGRSVGEFSARKLRLSYWGPCNLQCAAYSSGAGGPAIRTAPRTCGFICATV